LVAEPAVTTRSQADRLESIEEGQQARGLLEQLRPEQRQVLELSFDQGMSQQEIAKATKLPLGTVKTHTRRGLTRLRQLLETASTGSAPEGGPKLLNHGTQL
jgi:RNA polymerase sigma-70 factor (ECF subfamily)